jgi:hypothetical protein
MLEVITEGKNELMKQIQYIDGEMNVLGRGADAERWRKRYQLECELEELMENKEMYWQQPGGEKWIPEGEDNTRFFLSDC